MSLEIEPSVNVLGGELQTCSGEPLTGFFRNGCCDTGPLDRGSHTVCAIMTEEFLAYSKYVGNDLTTRQEEYGFPGLKEATNGACAPRAFCKPAKKEPRRKSGWNPPTRRLLKSFPSKC